MGTTAFNQLWDKDWTWNNGTNDLTGAWRPFFPSDFASNVSVSGLSVTVGSVAVTGGTITVNNTAPIPVSGVVNDTTLQTGLAYLNTLTFQNQLLLQAISGGTALANNWKTVTSSGYVQSFNPISGKCLINKVNGYSVCPQNTNFIQVFDSLTQTGTPVAQLIVQSGNNFFYEFSSSQGVTMSNGITVANSSDPLSILTGAADFIVTIIYKILP